MRALEIILCGGHRLIRFLPSYLIQEVVDRVNEAKSIVIDSAVASEPDLHASIAVMAEYANYLREGN